MKDFSRFLGTLIVDTHEVETNLSRLHTSESIGEEITTAKAGPPMARLALIAGKPQRRVPGSAAGEVTVAPDFDASLPEEILESFEQ